MEHIMEEVLKSTVFSSTNLPITIMFGVISVMITLLGFWIKTIVKNNRDTIKACRESANVRMNNIEENGKGRDSKIDKLIEQTYELKSDVKIIYYTIGNKFPSAYEKAVELNPEYADAYLNLGKLLYRSGERQKAIESFDRVIRLEPGSDRAQEALRYLKALGK